MEKYLIVKYSYNFVNILIKMLEVNENLRPDFIELDDDLYQKWNTKIRNHINNFFSLLKGWLIIINIGLSDIFILLIFCLLYYINF